MRKRLFVAIGMAICIIAMGCGSAAPVAESNNAATSVAADNNGVASEDAENLVSKYANFELTSENLVKGIWDDVISNTEKGENKSPQLSWEPVEGAEVYGIYMVDNSAQHWIHWKSNDIRETNLPLGAIDKSEYIGPYPPSGSTHTYDIYVIAMKKPVERLKGSFNGASAKIQQFIDDLDTDVDGNTGNIISCGHISGEFSY